MDKLTSRALGKLAETVVTILTGRSNALLAERFTRPSDLRESCDFTAPEYARETLFISLLTLLPVPREKNSHDFFR